MAGTIARRSLQERLDAGETILCAEGYALGLARRGYIGTGVWTGQFMLDYPDVLTSMHYEFAHCGSDVVQALQYYLHREKMREIGHEDNLEKINRVALRLAKEVANKTGTLFAGNICNTNIYKQNDDAIKQEVRAMFDEQVRWAKEEGAEFIIGETYHWLEEAEIALEVIKSYNLPAIINFGVLVPTDGSEFNLLDSIPVGEACKTLLDKGAYLVGANCTRGPEQMVEVIEHIVKFCPPEKVCALPLGYRTTKEYPTLFALRDDKCPDNYKPYPHGLEAFGVSPVEIKKFTRQCLDLGLKFIGICCGNSGMLTNAMAREMGKTTIVSRYHDPESKGTDPYKFVEINGTVPTK